MLKLMVMAVVVLVAMPALAAEIDASGLTESQIAELTLIKEKMKTNRGSDLPDQAKKYAEVGIMVGQALGGAAKELNVAVNEFSTTPVGQITMAIVAWKLLGHELMHFIIGGMCYAIMIIIWIWAFRRMCIIKNYTYHENGKIQSIAYYGQGRYDKQGKCLNEDEQCDGTRGIMLLTLVLIHIFCAIVTWS